MAWDHANVESLNHLRLRLGVASQGYFEAQGSLGQGWGVWQRIFKAPLQNVSFVRAESPGRLGAASGFQHAENAETEGLKKKLLPKLSSLILRFSYLALSSSSSSSTSGYCSSSSWRQPCSRWPLCRQPSTTLAPPMPATREPSLLHRRSADLASHRRYASTKSEPEQTAALFEPHLQQIAKLAVLISLDNYVTADRCSPLLDAVVT